MDFARILACSRRGNTVACNSPMKETEHCLGTIPLTIPALFLPKTCDNLELFTMLLQMASTSQLHATHSPLSLHLITFGQCSRDPP